MSDPLAELPWRRIEMSELLDAPLTVADFTELETTGRIGTVVPLVSLDGPGGPTNDPVAVTFIEDDDRGFLVGYDSESAEWVTLGESDGEHVFQLTRDELVKWSLTRSAADTAARDELVVYSSDLPYYPTLGGSGE